MTTLAPSSAARELHARSVVLIAHDHLGEAATLLSLPTTGLTGKVLHVSVDADVWSSPEVRQASVDRYTGFTEPARQELERVAKLVADHPEALLLATSAEHLREAQRTGRTALVIGFEGGKPLERDLGLLHEFHARGLRVLQLTWAGGNYLCDYRAGAGEGLTAWGREIVQECNRLGLMIDPGHCSRRAFDEVLELSTAPVGVLHAIPAGSKPGAGDLSDEQLRALAAEGGIIGLHFFSHYLHPRRPATVEDLVDHVTYVADLIGLDHVALGGDYLELTPAFREGHGLPASGFLGIPPDLDHYDKLVNITDALLRRGFSPSETQQVLGENLLRVWREVWGS
jgi:membrane dipeptidase